MKKPLSFLLALVLCSSANAQNMSVTPDEAPHHGKVMTPSIKSASSLRLDTTGTGIEGLQFMGNLGSSSVGKYNYYINGAQALEITDNWWNPNATYQGAPTAWPVISSGALAGGPDNIAVIGVNSSIYPSVATGASLAYMTRGATGEHHFWNNGFLNFTIEAGTNPNGNDTYDTSTYIDIAGCPTGGACSRVAMSTQNNSGTEGNPLFLFYNAGTGNFDFETDNITTDLLQINKGATTGGDGLSITSGSVGSGPTIQTVSSGSNASLIISTKGNSVSGISLNDGGTTQVRVLGNTTNGFIQMSGGTSTGNPESISAQESSNNGLLLYTSDTGPITFKTNNTANTVMTLLNSKVVQLNGYTTAGLLSNDTSGNILSNVPTTGLALSAGVLSSNAAQTITFQPGLATAVNTAKTAFVKVSKASTVDNITISAQQLTCGTNPVVTLFECGTSTTCATPTTIGSVTLTATGTATPATVSSSAIAAGDYVAWAVASGTCSVLDLAGTAQIHSN